MLPTHQEVVFSSETFVSDTAPIWPPYTVPTIHKIAILCIVYRIWGESTRFGGGALQVLHVKVAMDEAVECMIKLIVSMA